MTDTDNKAPARRPRRPPMRTDPFIRALMPVGRSPWAIASGYLGLLSVLLVPGPLAILTGILGILDIGRHPERHGMGRCIFGIMMGAVATVVLVVLMVR
jgi:hypothetical protein